jgi:tRNA (pseudouridine54-N1)-methyltransferase
VDGDVTFFVGDHLGFDPPTRASLLGAGASPVGLGPVSLHAEDAVAVVSNDIDRRQSASLPGIGVHRT